MTFSCTRSLSLVPLTLAFAAACSEADSEATDSTGDPGVNSAGGVGDAGGGPATNQAIGTDGLSGMATTGNGGTGGVEEEACVTETTTAILTPPVLQFVVDRSGSMNLDAGEGQTRWDAIVAALKLAVEQIPHIVAVGISYFPTNTGCQVSGEGSLPIALLDGEQRKAFESSLQDNAPFELGGTPTEDAFAYAVDALSQSPLEGPKYVVLLTDGSPTYAASVGDPATATKSEGTCNGNGEDTISEGQQQDLIDAVQDALARSQIGTFVIGAPGTTSARPLLSRMAEAGGTQPDNDCSDAGPEYCHFDLNSYESDELVSKLTDTIKEITGSTLGCRFEVPPVPGGKVFEVETIGVELAVAEGEPMQIERDPSETECNTGWQISEDGTVIELCGDVCDLAQQEGRIDIVYRCDDEVR